MVAAAVLQNYAAGENLPHYIVGRRIFMNRRAAAMARGMASSPMVGAEFETIEISSLGVDTMPLL